MQTALDIEKEKKEATQLPEPTGYRILIAIPEKEDKTWRKLITKAGTEIDLHDNPPAHSPLSQCNLALTTVGANTAELGALGVPMIVIVPTQHLNVMQQMFQ